MGVTIGGAKFTSIGLTRNSETGNIDMTGTYVLESNTGIVLAKQAVNGYQDVKLAPSPATQKLMIDLKASLENDLSSVLGLN